MSFEELMVKYTLPVLAMGAIVMVLVGFIKIFTKMIAKKEKEDSKLAKVMSYLYVLLAVIATVGVDFAYHAIFKLPYEAIPMVEESLSIFACSQALYPLYRDYGGRFLLLKFVSLFKGKSSEADKVLEIIEKVMPLTTKQKETLKDNFKKDL